MAERRIKLNRIEIITRKQPLSIAASDVVNADVKLSVHNYVDRCYCSFNDNNYNAFRDLERGLEIRVLVLKPDGDEEEIFYGLIDKVQIDFDKTKDRQVVSFNAGSFAMLLTTFTLKQYEVKYQNGYGEVIKHLADSFHIFNLDSVLEDNKKGVVYFDKISILEAMRTLAYVKGWCLLFKGRAIYFETCKEPTHSGITITDKDMISGTFMK